MTMDVEAEIRDLKRRVSEIEGSSGFLIEQVRGVHRDLLAFQTKTERRFEGLDRKFEGLDSKFERLSRKFDGLREDLPAIVGDAVRAVVRDGRRRPRK